MRPSAAGPRAAAASCSLDLRPVGRGPPHIDFNSPLRLLPIRPRRFAKPTASGGLNITYTYAYGCTNSFTAMVTPSPSGSKPLPPGTVTYTDCDYSMRWVTAAQKTATCTPPVIPPTACESALSRLCSGAKRAGKGNCFICTGQHQQDFLQAHCAQHDFDHFCS
eukprot:COSAG06_NODE_382_length_16566_cov_8.629137_15_plen_164_part_00